MYQIGIKARKKTAKHSQSTHIRQHKTHNTTQHKIAHKKIATALSQLNGVYASTAQQYTQKNN
jgi:hypothetical protein